MAEPGALGHADIRSTIRPRRKGAKPSDLALRGMSAGYVGLLIALPIIAISVRSLEGGLGRVWSDVAQPEALYSIRLTFLVALLMIAINSLMGTMTAWVLIRHRFPLQSIINALIDLPFAIPTVVTGLMLVVLYGPRSSLGTFLSERGLDVVYAKPGIVLALLFVTYPFVVRAVQPVLMEMEPEMEEAAATLGAGRWMIFRKVVLPSIAPAILTGAAQAFSRAIGEFGSVVIVAGNIPMKTQVGSVYIYGELESYNPRGALGISVVLLASSLAILILLNLIQRWGRRHDVYQ